MLKYIIALLAISCSLPLSAQNLSLGLKAGIGYTGTPVSGTQVRHDRTDHNKVGFQLGVFVKRDFGFLSLQSELFYSYQGGTRKTEETDIRGILFRKETTEHLGYLQVPLLLKYENASGLNGFIGPQFGFLQEERLKETFYKAVDISAVFGLGYESSYGFGFDFRYNLGLSNMYTETYLESIDDRDNDTIDDRIDAKQVNQSFQLSISYALYRTRKE